MTMYVNDKAFATVDDFASALNVLLTCFDNYADTIKNNTDRLAVAYDNAVNGFSTSCDIVINGDYDDDDNFTADDILVIDFDTDD